MFKKKRKLREETAIPSYTKQQAGHNHISDLYFLFIVSEQMIF